jgi:hypothetical protein
LSAAKYPANWACGAHGSWSLTEAAAAAEDGLAAGEVAADGLAPPPAVDGALVADDDGDAAGEQAAIIRAKTALSAAPRFLSMHSSSVEAAPKMRPRSPSTRTSKAEDTTAGPGATAEIASSLGTRRLPRPAPGPHPASTRRRDRTSALGTSHTPP